MKNSGSSEKNEAVEMMKYKDDEETLSKMLPTVVATNIEFQNVSYTIRCSDGSRKLLQNLRGHFRSGELTAVLGPSGAGKTTLLNVLAGYAATPDSGGSVKINGMPRESRHFRKICSYIMQNALLQPYLTSLEAMLVASRLKVAGLSEKTRKREVMNIMETLGIAECANTGPDALSGGQQKRLSIALELISNPSVLFLDEPTTGLDIHAGKMVMRALATLASQGRTIICTVHQPSPLEFLAYNHVYVVAQGQCAFSGPPTRLVPFLQEANIPCPTTHSPADYIIELIQMNPQVIDHLAKLVTAEQAQTKPAVSFPARQNVNTMSLVLDIPVPSELTKLHVLLRRMLVQRWRNWVAIVIQVLHHIMSGVLCGITFYGIGNDASYFVLHTKIGMVAAVFYVYTYVMTSILCFPLEVEIVKREHFNNWYGSLTYYVAYTISNIPIMIPNVIIFTMTLHVMSDLPLEMHRISYFLLIGYVSSFCSEGLGMFIGSLGKIKNGCVLGPCTLGPIFALSVYGVGFGPHVEPIMLFLMSFSYMRYVLVGCWIAIFGLNREPLNCSEIYCHWSDPELSLRDIGVGNETAWSAFGALCAYSVLHRIIGYAVVCYRLQNTMRGNQRHLAVIELTNKVITYFQKSHTSD